MTKFGGNNGVPRTLEMFEGNLPFIKMYTNIHSLSSSWRLICTSIQRFITTPRFYQSTNSLYLLVTQLKEFLNKFYPAPRDFLQHCKLNSIISDIEFLENCCEFSFFTEGKTTAIQIAKELDPYSLPIQDILTIIKEDLQTLIDYY